MEMPTPYSFYLNKFEVEFANTPGISYDHPIARSGHRMIIDGYDIYSFGGYNPILGEEYKDPAWEANSPQFSEVWKYNIIRRKWTRIPTLCKHPGLASHCLVQSGRLAILFGGTVKEFHQSSNNKLTIFNLDTEGWSENIKTTGSKPRKFYGQGSVIDGNHLYIIGGTQGHEFSMDVHVLNISEKTWTYLQTTNATGVRIQNRYRHELIKHGDQIFVIGGGESIYAFPLSVIPTLNLTSLSWTLTQTSVCPITSTHPRRRKCHVALKYKNYIYVHGGQTCVRDGDDLIQEPWNDLWRLSLDTFVWETMNTSENYLLFHSGVMSEDGCLYIFGGTTNNNTKTNQIERIWLDVPSLRTMAMNAVNHYAPHLQDRNYIDLLLAGIPRCYVKELRPSDFS